MEDKSILVVEDDRDIRESVQAALELQGHSVTAALDGLDGFEKMNTSQKFNLVLLDVSMPMMSGEEFLKRMSKIRRFKNVPVVLVSAAPHLEQLAATSDKVAGCLSKPIDFTHLASIVEKFAI